MPSLQFSLAAEDRQFYRLLVRNLSSQAVTELVIARSSPSTREVISGFENGKPVILPGASRQYEFSSSKVMCPEPDSSSPDAVLCPSVLEAAFFADASRDGDAGVLAEIEARHLSSTSNQPQLRELVRNILGDSSQTDAKKIALLRSEIPKLP